MSGRLISPAPISFLKIALAIWGVLCFHANCKMIGSNFVKNIIDSLIGIAYQFFGTQSSLWSKSHISTWLLEKPYLWLYRPLLANWCLCFVSFSSVTQLSLTLCDPMNCSMPGFPVHHQFLGSCSYSCSSSQWWHPTISASVVPFSSCLQSFPASGSHWKMSQFLASSGQNIGASASTSVLPMNIQDWFPSGWTGWISLQFKGLSMVFYNCGLKTSVLQSSAYFIV